jgi:uncharacterized membrane protein YbhN (UPF0104 family)
MGRYSIYTVKGAAFSDLFFVNTLGMGFGSGAIVFFVLVLALLASGFIIPLNQNKTGLAATVGMLCIIITISAGILGFIAAAAVLALLEYVLRYAKTCALTAVLICARLYCLAIVRL